MKKAVSVSIGSSKRNKAVETNLLGEDVSIERIGTDGDMEAAALKYKELDGTVDAFGVGGGDLSIIVDSKVYILHSVRPMVRYIKKTPVVDGSGLRNTLEKKAAPLILDKLGDYLNSVGKTALIMTGSDRWGLTRSFLDAGFKCTFGDLLFGLEIPIAVHTDKQIKTLAALLLPIATRLPFDWIYPVGEKQEVRKPKFPKYFKAATVVAGDCHYIKRFMPDDMQGKIIVTNTTTSEDVELFTKCGVKYLITTTPVLEGRSFGTNMMEAAMVAVAGKGRPLTWEELNGMLAQLHQEPQLQELN
jgi:hypothetical protein